MNKTHRNVLDSLESTSNIYTHICSRHKVEIITSISHFLLSQSGTRLHYSFFLMSASEVESEGLGKIFYDVLESLDSNGCNIPVLFYRDDFAQWFTSKRCLSAQKNALPTHLNGNVSQSPRLFSSVAFHLCLPFISFGPSSSAPLDRLINAALFHRRS